jgi:hypothetical protein
MQDAWLDDKRLFASAKRQSYATNGIILMIMQAQTLAFCMNNIDALQTFHF